MDLANKIANALNDTQQKALEIAKQQQTLTRITSPGQPALTLLGNPEGERQEKLREDQPMPLVTKKPEDVVKPALDNLNKMIQPILEFAQQIQDELQRTFNDAIYNAFSSAFSGEGLDGIFKSFGKTILAGLGEVFTQMGETYLKFGAIMDRLKDFLYNPATAGWAATAIGIALIGLGSALGALGSGAGQGTAAAGSYSTPGSAGTPLNTVTQIKVVSGNTQAASQVTPAKNVVYQPIIIGPNDPVAQKGILQLMDNANRRG
jgi:hypothetical protein